MNEKMKRKSETQDGREGKDSGRRERGATGWEGESGGMPGGGGYGSRERAEKVRGGEKVMEAESYRYVRCKNGQYRGRKER